MLPAEGEIRVPEETEPRQEQSGSRELLSLLRYIAISVDTALIAFTVIVDSMGRLFVDEDFHVSEILFGTLITSWLVLLGFEGKSLIERVIKNGKE